MAWQSTNETWRSVPAKINVLPPERLPKGVPLIKDIEKLEERDEKGRFRPGARTSQSRGGMTRKESVKLSRKLSMADPMDTNPEFVPYRAAAIAFKKAQTRYLAETVGGGVCSAGPASIVASAAWQLAVSRYMFDQMAKTGNMQLAITASKMANESKMSLMAAFELVAREAKARVEAGDGDNLARQQREFQKKLGKKVPVAPEFIVTEGTEA